MGKAQKLSSLIQTSRRINNMEKSNVYFADMSNSFNENLLQKLKRLCITAGIKNIDFENQFVAVKMHFGEPGNLAYLRPNYAKAVCDLVKELGGKPFLTDCNTLYVGGRKNALDHLDSAYQNGFNPFATGVHVIIADGLKGTDETLVPINQKWVKEAKIGKAIMDADIVISLSHFKGHEEAGFGGALKNLGMGCGSRAGKMEQHCDSKPQVNEEVCRGCGTCQKICAHEALQFNADHKMHIDETKCVGCGRCIAMCPFDAIEPIFGQAFDILNEKIAEYSYAVIHGRPSFHIALAIDVSPECDCAPYNDKPIVADVGMFASFDPVALDQACADACNASPTIPGSVLDRHGHEHHDCFKDTHPETDWKSCLAHAEEIGLGTREYHLIKI